MRAIAAMSVVAFVVLAVVDAASAQEEDFGRPGWFVGGGLNFAVEQFDVGEVEVFTGFPLDVSNSLGVDVRGGYRFNEYVAVEGNFQYYSNFDLENRFNSYDDISLDAFSFFANVKGYPLSGRFQPYGLFGLGVQAAEVVDDYNYYDARTDATFALKVGGGIDIYITDHILGYFDVNYMFTTSDLNFGGPADVGTNIIPMSFGVQYRF